MDLDAAEKKGIPVFNSPFANTRSVAELVLAEVIALSRQVCDRSAELHRGEWNKVKSGRNFALSTLVQFWWMGYYFYLGGGKDLMRVGPLCDFILGSSFSLFPGLFLF